MQDGKFDKIGFVNGHGSTPFGHDYRFTDKMAEAGQTYFYFIEDIDIEGKRERSNIISITFKPQIPLPTHFKLYQNFPNPFNPETFLPFQLPKDTDVTIEIYNLNGKLVRILSLGMLPAGYYDERANAAYWDGRTNTGEKCASGIYFYRLKIRDCSAVKRMFC